MLRLLLWYTSIVCQIVHPVSDHITCPFQSNTSWVLGWNRHFSRFLTCCKIAKFTLEFSATMPAYNGFVFLPNGTLQVFGWNRNLCFGLFPIEAEHPVFFRAVVF